MVHVFLYALKTLSRLSQVFSLSLPDKISSQDQCGFGQDLPQQAGIHVSKQEKHKQINNGVTPLWVYPAFVDAGSLPRLLVNLL